MQILQYKPTRSISSMPGSLPFAKEHQAVVRKSLLVPRMGAHALWGKTSSSSASPNSDLGEKRALRNEEVHHAKCRARALRVALSRERYREGMCT